LRLEKIIETKTVDKESVLRRDTAQIILSEMTDVLLDSLPPNLLNPLAKRFGKFNPVKLDQYILMPLYRAYFAAPPPVQEDEISTAVMTYLQNDDRDLYFIVGEKKLSFAEMAAVSVAPLSREEQDLINRFVYMRLFTRLFFGPGFSMMPLISGLFHLSALVVLLQLDRKIDSLRLVTDPEAPVPTSFERLVGRLRDVDRRLTAVVYTRNTGAMFELFALDPLRLRRFLLMTN